MGRSRACMQMISRKKTREATFEKRGMNLKKKAYELSTLCGVKVCLIIFPQRDGDGQPPIQPKTWPEGPQDIRSLLDSFLEFKADDRHDKRCKATHISDYLKDRIKKAEGDIAKIHKKILRAKFPTWGEMYEELSGEEMRELAGLLEAKLEAMRYRVDFLKNCCTVGTFPTETSGSNAAMMMNPSCDYSPLPHRDPMYMIPDWNFSNRATSNLEFELLQQQQQTQNWCSLPSYESGFQNSISFNPMVNPEFIVRQEAVPDQFPLLMDGEASGRNNVVFYNKCPADDRYMLEPLEHVAAAGDHNGVNGSYYVPAMQPAPLHLQPFLPSGAPTQINASEPNELWRGTYSVAESQIYKNELFDI